MNHTSLAALIATLFGAASLSMPLTAQDSTRSSSPTQIGIYGTFQRVQYTVGPNTGVAGLPCCGSFSDGTGAGFAVGALYQFPLVERLAMQLRGSYAHMGGSITSREVIGNALEQGKVVDAEVEYGLDPSIGILSFDPMVSWRPFELPLGINVGAQIGALIRSTARQRETLLSPGDATFTNGSTVRNEGGGQIEANGFYAAGIAGLSYDLPVGRSLVLTPEVAWHLNFSNAAPGAAWRGDALRLGASLRMQLEQPGKRAERSEPQEQLRPKLSAVVQTRGLYADNSEQPIVTVRVEEFLGTQMRPLLNYLFFDDNDSRLQPRYVGLKPNETGTFSVDRLHGLGVLETYHQILNVVGRRMLDYPEATLTLVGCNAEAGDEKGNADVAARRARTVRDYLHTVWNIPASRMTVEVRGLPEKPSNVHDPDGIGENRRVEIYSDDLRILEPVLTSDTLRSATPPSVRFHMNVESQAGVASWRLIAGQSGRTLKEFTGTGPVPAALDWQVADDQTHAPRYATPIDYQLEVIDATGQRVAAPVASIPIKQVTIQQKRTERIADMEVDRYSLILFDFDRAELNQHNRTIAQFIKERAKQGATVTVTGFTDRMGEAGHNERLSQARARATAASLGVSPDRGRGIGESQLLFDNELPEGRFYCRTVNVVVQTAIR